MITQALIFFGMVLAWDVLRRFAQRNDEFDPHEIEQIWDHMHSVEDMAKQHALQIEPLRAGRDNQAEHISDLLNRADRADQMGPRLDDLIKVVANHAAALQKHGSEITNLSLAPLRGRPRG